MLVAQSVELYDTDRYYAGLEDGGMTRDVVNKKYIAPDDNVNLYRMWMRVARAAASVEKNQVEQEKRAYEFLGILKDFVFVPGGRILHGAGRESARRKPTLSNCYVIGIRSRFREDIEVPGPISTFIRLVADTLWEPEDALEYVKHKFASLEGTSAIISNAIAEIEEAVRELKAFNNTNSINRLIDKYTEYPSDSVEAAYDWLKEAAMVYRTGGGVGVDVGVFRPKGSPVNATISQAPGATWFMNLMSESTNTISQSGRRGALMITIPVWHPDVEDFITIKNDPQRSSVKYANISVKVTDDFMRAVERNEEYSLRWRGVTYRKVNARDLWMKIIENAWASAEPGIIFWDRMTQYHNLEHLDIPLLGVNPCAEQPLADSTACNLGAINLSKFVNEEGEFSYERFRHVVRVAVRFMDNIIDYNAPNHATGDISDSVLRDRRVGLGIMGLADMLIKMGIRYDTEEALEVVEKIMRIYRDEAYLASVELAKERGPFPAYDFESYKKSGFYKSLPEHIRVEIMASGIRNGTLLTVAPTGTTAIAAMTSSGIEPIFQTSYTRRVKQDDGVSFREYKVYHPLIKDLFGDDQDLPDYVVTAHQIDPNFRVRMQAVIQRYVDASISSTVNLPEDAQPDDIAGIYETAWKEGLKGITVYREGSREGILISEKKTAEQRLSKTESSDDFDGTRRPTSRPKRLYGYTEKIRTGQGNMLITINEDQDGNLFEVIARLGKSGGDDAATCEALSRVISIALRAGVDPWEIVDQLKDQAGAQPVIYHFEGSDVGTFIKSTPDAIGQALEFYLRSKEIEDDTPQSPTSGSNGKGSKCPECGSPTGFINENGCGHCVDCGYSKCG